MIKGMGSTCVDEAVELLEKSNADLEPELQSVADARARLRAYTRAQRLAAFGVAALARRLDDASELARVTGTSVGRAKETVATGKVLGDSAELNSALKQGDISMEQASEIARAEQAAPGVAAELVAVADKESFQVLRERARKAKLEAEQHRDLAQRQHAARSARSYSDELGMVHIHVALEPHVGTPLVARAEAEAQQLARASKAEGLGEPFERYLADAYAALLTGSGKGRARRPELVVLVGHEVARRGWKDVRAGEVCKIPGMGPVSPQVAREIAHDAFLNGVFFDGGSAPVRPLDQKHPRRGGDRAGAGRAAWFRRGLLHRLRQPLPHRVRPRRAARSAGSQLPRQPQASLLVMPPGQDRTGSSCRKAQASRTLRKPGAAGLPKALFRKAQASRTP